MNFVSERSALPFGEETDPGLSIMFRMGFGGGNTIGVALTETKGGVYPNKNTAPDHPGFEGLDEWGGFGILSNPSGVLGKNITLKLQKAEEGVSLTLALEGGNTGFRRIVCAIPRISLPYGRRKRRHVETRTELYDGRRNDFI